MRTVYARVRRKRVKTTVAPNFFPHTSPRTKPTPPPLPPPFYSRAILTFFTRIRRQNTDRGTVPPADCYVFLSRRAVVARRSLLAGYRVHVSIRVFSFQVRNFGRKQRFVVNRSIDRSEFDSNIRPSPPRTTCR